MEGFWLEGGQPTFWNQPLYRWISGVLHLLFGDSSAGELIWDGFGLLVGAMFAYAVVNRFGGFRNGIAAAVGVLVTVSIAPTWYHRPRPVGISALLWIYLAACCLLDARSAPPARAALAGLFATLAFYTRMNHLALVLVLPVVTLVDGIEAGSAFDLRRIWDRLPKRVVVIYELTLAVGLFAFAARTWVHTGRLSLFAVRSSASCGCRLAAVSIRSGPSSLARGARERADDGDRAGSAAVRLALAHGDRRVQPGGAGLAARAVRRRVPLGVAIFCVAGIAGGVVARGSAYPGRFSCI